MRPEYNKNLVPRAKDLRRDMTPQEGHLWYDFLRRHPLRFRRQSVIYHYIADFYCDRAKLVIELDGSQHARPDALEYDRIRTLTLESIELAVLRFTNAEVDNDFAYVCRTIEQALQERVN
ncbi:MAG: endonuclease domain-containing protein [Oscillospiraceae bacterium]|jgi:very-short-patch-repair endonuclease|nr:endonuclease domain-containing protein [Oscillospiraceae bacterium]